MKNKLRKMLSLVLAVVIAMSAISVNTLAATRMNIANGSNQKLYVDWYGYSYNFNGRLNTSTYGQIIKLNVGSSTGQVAYCIQSSKDAWTGDYTAQDYYDDLSRAQKLNLKHALIYGYQGTTNYGYNADTERIATQIVIWNICDGWFNNFAESTAVGIFTEGMSSSMATNVKACYNKIKEQMLSHTTIPSYAVGKGTFINSPQKGKIKIVKTSYKYYTDATLLTAMELAGDNIEDEQTRNLIKLEKRGLGTAATRQGIIKELYEKGYIARRTKKNGNMIKGIMPTEKGMYIIDALEKTVPDMLSVDMTSDMEMELDKIARGKSDGNDFLNNYKKLVAKWVELIKNSDTSAMAGNTLICPLCSKPLIKKKVGWCCTGYSKDNPDSCRFYIANEICGKKISDVIAKELTLKRSTSIIKGFTSQSGKTFDAKLTIKADNTIGFEFPERLKCPVCGKEMIKSSKGWVCTGYKNGCNFL